jgi:hypothetical protein
MSDEIQITVLEQEVQVEDLSSPITVTVVQEVPEVTVTEDVIATVEATTPEINVTVILGDAGPAGATGATGANGADGADGNTVLYGTLAPTTEGVDGDFYIRTSTNYIYGPKSGGV